MAFSVLPAIDVAEGRLAVWTPGGPRPIPAFDGDPLAAARSYADAGARWAHVVDLDHAFHGEPLRADLLEAVAAQGLAVQASGGIADLESLDSAFGAGARRVVVGSAALGDEGLTASLLASGPAEGILVGLECRDGAIVARGRDDVVLELAGTLGWLVAAGAPGFLVTTVPRVGGLGGPDLGTIRRVVRAGRPVIAAGGIASVEDLRSVRAAGAIGAVVGRAALEGGLDLRAALAWADAG